jgi:Ser/Thr protein kinase RdoA (MazF antagonist)
MADLERALATHPDHPLAADAQKLGAAILDDWQAWLRDGRLDLPEHTCHGDLKISNLRFAAEPLPRAVCLLDLDTLGPQMMASEMGDAWRSWCNPAGEENPEAVRFDFEIFAASARAWSAHVGDLTSAEAESLVPGIERICLELAARFCADVLNNSYFRENRERFPQPGRHNLVRATSQRRLAALARVERPRCQDLMEGLW